MRTGLLIVEQVAVVDMAIEVTVALEVLLEATANR